MLLTFLAFAYLFVGLSHTVSCAAEAVSAAISSNADVISDERADRDGAKKSGVVAGHCHVCAPVLMAAPVAAGAPSERPIRLVFLTPKLSFGSHPRLDTPPPKHLT